jgi:hypothetical protein
MNAEKPSSKNRSITMNTMSKERSIEKNVKSQWEA